jgi:hypothetical protein
MNLCHEVRIFMVDGLLTYTMSACAIIGPQQYLTAIRTTVEVANATTTATTTATATSTATCLWQSTLNLLNTMP